MIEIWGKPACPSCTKAKALCESRQYKYVYKELGKDFDREEVFKYFLQQEPSRKLLLEEIKQEAMNKWLTTLRILITQAQDIQYNVNRYGI